MKKIAFYDAKPYDKIWFDQLAAGRYDIRYLESKCNPDTAQLARGCEAVCAFVNDDLSQETIDRLYDAGVRVLAMRSAGYSNVDFKAAYEKINVVRVPAYSPYAVAEHAMALLLTLNRKVHKAYNRTRDFNFSLNGLIGTDLHGKTAGIIGTGKIGRVFINICRGFGMRILAFDPYPAKDADFEYVDLNTLLRESDVMSLHCPLTDQTHHILDVNAFRQMKKEAFIINTSRGALIDSAALLA
ncbi:MAG: 2-hydroxyacid dehydrogenase, partial [Clostridia bacterium]|nr:2-hydroxyacid dehydrogenase [Clostridia bacterium]